jgi:aspartyl-tRNA(Asn)/glutamyl-tRNA(Gln) amidotransferase subunit A
VGFLRENFAEFGEPEVEQAYVSALGTLKAAGAVMSQVTLPDFPYDAVASTVVSAEAAAAFEDFIRSGRTEQLIDQEGKVGLFAGRAILAADYLKAQRLRSLIQQELLKLLTTVDVLVAPSVLVVAPPVDADLNEVFKGGGAIEAAGNLAGLPALSIPCGFGRDHLPAGLQIVSKPFEEATLIEVARAFQAKTAWHHERPPLSF